MLKDRSKHVHCIGIGGIGVSALAELLFLKGFSVSGSDLKDNAQTRHLAQVGVPVDKQHDAANIADADCVIYSSAVSKDNPEYIAASAKGLPLLSRGQALAELINSDKVISIAGTHGKTTTTALTAHVLTQAGFDPSYAIGGVINGQSSPAHVGQGDPHYFVAEADESDASFLYLQPLYAVVTNIDADHLEAYGGDFKQLKRSFLDHLAKVPAEGAAIICIDDPVVAELLPQISCRVITYGFSAQADVRAVDYQQQGLLSCFKLVIGDQTPLAVSLSLSGRHNVQNALAAIALANEVGAPINKVSESLAHFSGVQRRFQLHGNMKLVSGEAIVIEDYGHHPEEIRVTIDAARSAYPDRRVVIVFQPHRYTRTRDLYQDFVTVLGEADQLFLLDIYAASEEPIDGINSEQLANDIFVKSARLPTHVTDLRNLPRMLHQQLQGTDMLILQGAGSVGSIADDLVLF